MASQERAALGWGAESGGEGDDRSSVPRNDHSTDSDSETQVGFALTSALRYAGLELSIVPVYPLMQEPPDDPWVCTCRDGAQCTRPGKHVAVPWKKYQTIRPSDEQLRGWLRDSPSTGMAVVCGAVSNIVDVEIDPRNGGEESWAKLSRGRDEAATWTSRSGGGGLHRFFKLPRGGLTSRAGVLPGIDVQAEGKLAVLPPSRHRSGKVYEWLPGRAPWDCRLADMPGWLLGALGSEKGPAHAEISHVTQPPEPIEVDSLGISERIRDLILGREATGDRSRDTYAVECAMIEAGYDDPTIAAAIWHNAVGDKAREQGLSWVMEDIACARHKNTDDRGVPPLPSSAWLDPSLGADACPWLDEYIAWSRHWSPRSFDDFHETCGLALLSIVAARRVVVPFGGDVFTNLYVMLAARSSIYAKTTAVRLMVNLLENAGLRGLLAPDDITPERLLAGMGGYLDENSQPDFPLVKVKDHTSPETQVWDLRTRYAPQRGWIHNELGRLISGLASSSSYYSPFRSVIRELDDCPKHYEVARMGRPSDSLTLPYLSIVGSLTPADLRGLGRGLASLFSDGFFARFAVVCPPPGHPVSTAQFPRGECVKPPVLAEELRRWHERLPEAEYENIQKKDAKVRDKGGARVKALPTQPVKVSLSEEARDRYYAYSDALTELIASREETLLDGCYARSANRALRVAALLASVSGEDTIELRHWVRAQEIVERWRAGLHHLWSQVNQEESEGREERLQERILLAHQKASGPMSIRDITRGWRVDDRKIFVEAYAALVATGELVEIESGRGSKYDIPERVGVTANCKLPKMANIKLPTLVKWSHGRHNGLVSHSAGGWATHVASGETFHDQGTVSQGCEH